MLGIVFVWDVIGMLGLSSGKESWDYPLERKDTPGGALHCSENWDVFNLCFLEFGNGVPLSLHRFVAAALAFALAALRTNSK